VKLKSEFRRYKVFLIDGDGVLWRGDQPIPEAIEAVNTLVKLGFKVALITNNSTLSTEDYGVKLARLGVKIPPNRIYTTSRAAASHLASKGFSKTYVVGEEGLVKELLKAGVKPSRHADSVTVGLDRSFNYRKLAEASELVRRGAYFLATNRDPTLPSPQGLIPGAGSIVAAIEVAAGRKPDVEIGKPQPYLYIHALEDLGADPSEALAIGDRIDTDVLGALNAGITPALVLTGATGYEEVSKTGVKPKYVLETLKKLFEANRD